MPKISKLDKALNSIIEFFDSYGCKVFTHTSLNALFNEYKDEWNLAKSTRFSSFLKALFKKSKLKKNLFVFPYRKQTRYTWGVIPAYNLIQSLKPNGYFTHFTAMSLNDLTNQIPATIYLNFEQSKKKATKNNKLEQKRIDYAFKSKPRMSKQKTKYASFTVYLINGKYTDQLGVIENSDEQNNQIRYTDLERTLIDIVVRPFYSGGVFELLKAFKAAADKVNIDKLLKYLKEINHVYPYHQSIGFLMEKSGEYKKETISKLLKLPLENNFYLTHKIRDKGYSEKWKLFFPKGF